MTDVEYKNYIWDESGEVADIDAWDQFYGITISAVYIVK